ncbi:hypothetical protein H5410_002748 [Solanum commersonii]|uniref:Uncharacterized protein n=1 Tax=Solanum commersonii TaxID=4109 RepID=A0A9J6B3R1_SOLCO|nr:hypothetical protein H5410_002748 [Solanum commersonii]
MMSSWLSRTTSSCTAICSSSISISDSVCPAASLCISPIVAGGVPKILGVSLSFAPPIRVVKLCCDLWSLPLIIAWVILAGWEEDKAPGTYEEEEGADVPEGSEVEVWGGAPAGSDSMLTSGKVSAGVALLLSAFSHVNLASIRRMSVEENGVTSISLAGSWGTLAHRQNSMIRTGDGNVVCICLARTAISCEISNPMSIRLLDMIDPRQATL